MGAEDGHNDEWEDIEDSNFVADSNKKRVLNPDRYVETGAFVMC